MTHIDLNCDVGEGAGHDAELMPLVSSVSIACGGHAGDVMTMRAAVDLAIEHGVAIGAHPGLPDRAAFGRSERPITPDEARALVSAQTQALMAVAAACGARVTHVKPHGALYNMAARDEPLARAVAEGVRGCGADLVLVGLAGSHLVEVAHLVGVRPASEAFADRTYNPDGSLTSRSMPGAVIDDADAVAAQALSLALDGGIVCPDGVRLAIRADTLCVHGDSARAVASLSRIRLAFGDAGIAVMPFVASPSR